MIKLQPKAKWVKFNHPLGGDWYKWGETRVCVAKEYGLWHISISCPHRYPTWDEIYTAWYDLVPGAGKDFNGAILLPRHSEYEHASQLFSRSPAPRRGSACGDNPVITGGRIVPLLTVRRKPNQLRKYRMGADDMLRNIRDCLEVRALGGTPNLKVADIQIMKIVDRIVARECDELITLLRRISNDVAQTIIEDPQQAAQGWMLMSKPVLKDLQTTLHEFVPENLAKKYRNGR